MITADYRTRPESIWKRSWHPWRMVETLLTYPTTQTHADVPKEIQEKNGLTDATLRMSVGIENVKDLIAELDQVFCEIENGQ